MSLSRKDEFTRALNEKIIFCRLCSDFNTKGGVYFSSAFDNLDLIFVAQNPGKSWYDKPVWPDEIVPFGLYKPTAYNRFFTFLSKEFFSEYAKKINFCVTNVVKCVTINNEVSQENIENCTKNILIKELKILRKYSPKAKVATLGKVASSLDIGDISLVHPGYMNRKPESFMKEQIEVVMNSID